MGDQKIAHTAPSSAPPSMSKILANRLINYFCLGGQIPKEDIIIDFLEKESLNIPRPDIELLFSFIDTVSLEQLQRVSAARIKFLPSSRPSSLDSSLYQDAHSTAIDQDGILQGLIGLNIAFGASLDAMQDQLKGNMQLKQMASRRFRSRSSSPIHEAIIKSPSLFSIQEDMENTAQSTETISEQEVKLAYLNSDKIELHSQKSTELTSRGKIAREKSEDTPLRIGGPRRMTVERLNITANSEEIFEAPARNRKLGWLMMARIQKLFK